MKKTDFKKNTVKKPMVKCKYCGSIIPESRSNTAVVSLWENVLKILENTMNPQTFKLWLKDTKEVYSDDSVLTVEDRAE